MIKEAARDKAAGLLGCRPVSETSFGSTRPLRTPQSARQPKPRCYLRLRIALAVPRLLKPARLFKHLMTILFSSSDKRASTSGVRVVVRA